MPLYYPGGWEYFTRIINKNGNEEKKIGVETKQLKL